MKYYLVKIKIMFNGVEKIMPSIRFAESPEEAGQMALEGESHGDLHQEDGYLWDDGAECGYRIQSVEELPAYNSAFNTEVMEFLIKNI